MKTFRRVLLALAALLPAVALAGQPILNLKDVAVPPKPDGSSYSVDDVQAAVIAGCRVKGWTPKIEEPGRISASILVRGKHYAEISITYTQSAYSIQYVTSRDLDYDAKTQEIHRNYNKWIILLSETIQRQFR
ncbi:MAG: hypothetical protein U1F08_10940 [Steroidobacteraceae bacterium]